MKIYVTTSTGSGPTKLAAFDDALTNAGIENHNLIKLSSIIPQGATLKIKPRGKIRSKMGNWGDRLYVVMADIRVDTPNVEAWAGIGWVQDKKTGRGVFVEHDGSSEETVRSDIKDSLKALLEHRPKFSGESKMVITGTLCKHEPVCALAIAVYAAEGWDN
jgi:arginine decarboxylase